MELRGMIEAQWHDHENCDALAGAVAERVGRAIANACDVRGEALIALPGGTSPTASFERLVESPVEWNRVTIVPTDDRLVSPSDPLSNFGLIARHFAAKGAQIVPMIVDGVADYRRAGVEANARLCDLSWPPDLVWLGVGADGHTASIFPGPDYEDAVDGPPDRRAVGLMPDPLPAEAPVARVTLTGAAIGSASSLLLTLSGAKKRTVVERALANGLGRTPIGRVLANAKTPIEIHWSAT
jgi:6-phosphogluconolactonase